jgi:hypothetical protein
MSLFINGSKFVKTAITIIQVVVLIVVVVVAAAFVVAVAPV